MRGWVLLFPACWGAFALFPEVFFRYDLTLGAFFTLLTGAAALYRSRDQFPIAELLPFFHFLSLWLAPALVYHLAAVGWYAQTNHNPLPKAAYYGILLPYLFALATGVFGVLALVGRGSDPEILRRLPRNRSLPWLLMAAGMLAVAIRPYAPGFLQFPLHIAGNLLPVGALLHFFKGRRMPLLGILLLIGWYLVQTFYSTYGFGTALFFAGFFLLFYFLKKPVPCWKKVAGLAALVGIALLVLAFKFGYRATLRHAPPPSQPEARLDYFWAKRGEYLNRGMLERQRLSRVIDRLNQGFLTAQVFRHVPEKEPFAGGQTIRDGLLAALVPRPLWPDKPQAGGREIFQRFTGKTYGNHSVNIGLTGEAYANYGPRGGALFLLFYGAGVALLVSGWKRLSRRWPLLFLWIPFLFFPVITPEMDFGIAINHLFKAGFMGFLLIFATSCIFSD